VFRWILDPAGIAPGTAMPSALFVKDKEKDRWIVNLPTLPPDVAAYHDDHARLLVRYMFMMTPDEQKRLLSASPAPAKPAATPAATTNKTTGRNGKSASGREQVSRNRSGRRLNGQGDRVSHHRSHHALFR
jgi:hypothetical protein